MMNSNEEVNKENDDRISISERRIVQKNDFTQNDQNLEDLINGNEKEKRFRVRPPENFVSSHINGDQEKVEEEKIEVPIERTQT